MSGQPYSRVPGPSQASVSPSVETRQPALGEAAGGRA